MDCAQALALLVADMDREIDSSDRALLQAHLKECAECRATAEALHLQDSDLRRAFAPRRRAATAVADRVIAQLRISAPRPQRRPRWGPLLLSAAAGFLLALLVFRPWERVQQPVAKNDGSPVQPKEEMAQHEPKAPQVNPETVLLTVANEAVEVMAPDSNLWQVLKGGATMPIGARVRTRPAVRCEFRTSDGSEVRLNGDTELLFNKARRLQLTKGQIMARVAKANSPFQVAIPEATVTALGTEFDILCKPVETVLTVLQGATEVQGKGGTERVQTGQAATIVDGRVKERRPIGDPLELTSWTNEILTLKGRDNEELAKRVDDLLAQIGQAKADFFNEQQIRSLGDHCVLPLTRFIQSERSQANQRKRQMAAKIVADLAEGRSIPDLIRLLADRDRQVRYQAARGLRRLTGETLGREPEAWRDQSWQSSQQTRNQWADWWQENKHRYPSVSSESPSKDVEKPSSSKE